MEVTKVMFTLALNLSYDDFQFLSNPEHGGAFDVSGPPRFHLISEGGVRAPHNFESEGGQAKTRGVTPTEKEGVMVRSSFWEGGQGGGQEEVP